MHANVTNHLFYTIAIRNLNCKLLLSNMAELVERRATGTDLLVNFVKKLGDIVKGIVSSLGSLVDGLKGSASTIEKISNEIAQTNVSFAIQLRSFSKELKLLDKYYTKVYIQLRQKQW